MASFITTRKTPPTVRTAAGIGQDKRMVFYDKDGNDMSHKRGWSMSRGIMEEFRDIHDWVNGNRVRLIDSMIYGSDALAKAAWAPSDDAATTGVTVTIDAVDKLNATSSVEFTVGSAFAAATNCVKTLSADWDNYPEDRFSNKGSYQNWTPYNYIIVPRHAEQALAATDVDLIITDFNGVTATYSLPEIDANHADVWGTYAVPFSSFTEGTGFRWDSVSTITLQFNGVTMGNDEVMSVDEIYLCKYCNGFTPASGTLVPVVLGADDMAEGMQCKLAGASLLPVVGKGGDGDEEIIGVLCGSGDTGDTALMQIGGVIVGELGALTSLEVGDALAGAAAGGLTWTEAAATNADAYGKYIAPFVDAAAQYTLAWIQLAPTGGAPS